MTERPILCSAPSVRAILDDTKTTTRRLSTREVYAEPGDTLWVREAWRTPQSCNALNAAEMAQRFDGAEWVPIQYVADGARSGGRWFPVDGPPPGRYRHARFMPRWASRITLRVLEVRVERLQAITEADAIAEGVEADHMLSVRGGSTTARDEFSALWDSINGKREYCAWADDPWVWVVRFERVGNGGEA